MAGMNLDFAAGRLSIPEFKIMDKGGYSDQETQVRQVPALFSQEESKDWQTPQSWHVFLPCSGGEA